MKSGFNDDRRGFSISLISWSVLFCSCLTFRPAWLLCRFISLRPSPSISRTSRNFLPNLMPKSMSTEQPPHFQDCNERGTKERSNDKHLNGNSEFHNSAFMPTNSPDPDKRSGAYELDHNHILRCFRGCKEKSLLIVKEPLRGIDIFTCMLRLLHKQFQRLRSRMWTQLHVSLETESEKSC